jgi:hypothetical protein
MAGYHIIDLSAALLLLLLLFSLFAFVADYRGMSEEVYSLTTLGVVYMLMLSAVVDACFARVMRWTPNSMLLYTL